jgi:hypothetical protein
VLSGARSDIVRVAARRGNGFDLSMDLAMRCAERRPQG